MATVELSVFGLGSDIDITIGTLALTGVVGFTVLFEMGAHRLEHRLVGTPYMGMLAKIYKELMIMGVISLGVFLTLELGGVDGTVGFYAFEFAHIVIFFAALIFVMQACLMMVYSHHIKKRYERSTNISVDHLLSIYSLHRKSKVFHARWLPFSDLREVMEFKIVHAFFQTTFALPTRFNFALYMQEASDSYILSLVDVESSTWLILLATCFLNLARIKTWQAVGLTPVDDDHAEDDHATDDHATDDHATDDHRRRWLGGSAVGGNTGSDGELAFMLSGWVLLTLAVGNYFLSRWSEIRLLRKAGCASTQDYHTRLCVIEKNMMEAKEAEERHRQEGQHNDHLERLKLQVDKAKGEGKHRHSHRKAGGGGGGNLLPDGGARIQREITKHVEEAKRHVQAVKSSIVSGEIAKGISGSQLIGAPMFRRAGGGGSSRKVVSRETDDETTSARDLPRPLGLRPSSSGIGGKPEHVNAGEVPQDGESITSNNQPKDMVVSTSASQETNDNETGTRGVIGEEKIAGSQRPAAAGEESVPDGRYAGEGEGESKVTTSREDIGTDRVVSAGEWEEEESGESGESEIDTEDGHGHRYAMVMPTTMGGKVPPAHPSQNVFVTADSPPLIEEESEYGSGDGSHIFLEDRGRKPRQLSANRRASVSMQRQARRMSVSAQKLTMKLASDVSKMARNISSNHDAAKLNLYNDISDIYTLSSPMLFHKTLDVLLLFSCTYMAIWAVNFLTVANAKPYPLLRHLGMLLPAAGVFLFNTLSVKTSSLLLAISAMDPEIIGKVLDEQIDQEKLVRQFRKGLTSHLEELGLGKSGLAAVFEEMDTTGRGELTIKELSNVLFKLNYHGSKEKYKKLFDVMDVNKAGVVSYHQLFNLVYNEEAAAQEATALKMRGKMHAIQ